MAEGDVNLELWPKQGAAFLSQATELLYGGAAGSGKSHLFRVASIAWSIEIAGLQTYFFRRNYPDLMSNHMEGEGSYPELLGPLVAAGMVRIDWQTPCIEWSNGSLINLRHCQHEKDIYKYQGAQIHVLIIDELTQFTSSMYRYLRSRMRKTKMLPIPDKYAGQFPKALVGANPGGIGHNWVKASWIDNAPPGEIKIMPNKEGGMKRQFIPARLEDNKSLDEAEYEGKLEGLGNPALVKAMRYGNWNIVAGGMFDDLWEKFEAFIVVDAFTVPESWRIDRSFDWGSSRPFSVGWWAESDGTDLRLADGRVVSTVHGDLYRIAEWYGWNGEEPDVGIKWPAVDIARGIVERELDMGLYGRVEPGPADTSIFDEENAVCIAKDMEQKIRLHGKEYPGITWERADKAPGSVEKGLTAIRERFAATARPKGLPREKPGLFVVRSCTQFIRVVPTAPRHETKVETLKDGYEDHIIDETRYRVRWQPRVVGFGRSDRRY